MAIQCPALSRLVACSVSLQHSWLGKLNHRESLIIFANGNNRYNALAGIADTSNSFFVVPVAHFPWSDKGREKREKVDNSQARGEQNV